MKIQVVNNGFGLKLIKDITAQCGFLFNNLKHLVDKKVHRQDENLSTGLTYAKKIIRGTYFSRMKKKFHTTEEMKR